MASKVIIFLVFASVAQGSIVPTLRVDYGLPRENVAELNTIITNEEKTGTIYSNGLKALFKTFFHPENSEIYEAFGHWKDAIDSTFNSAVIALGKSCPAIENARNATYVYLNDAAVKTSTFVITLVTFGNRYVNHNVIETRQLEVYTEYTNAVNSFYDALSTCLSTTDEEVLATIEKVRNTSLLAVLHLNNAIFNTVRVKAASSYFSCANETVTSKIGELRDKALVGIQEATENKFSLLRALYLNSHLNRAGIMNELFENQRALTISYRGYKEGNEVLFGSVVRHLREIQLGLNDDGKLSFSQDDADLPKVTAKFEDGDYAIIMDSFRAIHPESSANISASHDTIYTLNGEGNEAFYRAVAVATAKGTNLNDTLAQIEVYRHQAVDPAAGYIKLFFDLFRDKLTFDEKSEAELVAYAGLTTVGGQVAMSTFLDAVMILAKATNEGKVSETAFTDLEKLFDVVLSGLVDFCQGLSAGSLVALLVKHAN